MSDTWLGFLHILNCFWLPGKNRGHLCIGWGILIFFPYFSWMTLSRWEWDAAVLGEGSMLFRKMSHFCPACKHLFAPTGQIKKCVCRNTISGCVKVINRAYSQWMGKTSVLLRWSLMLCVVHVLSLCCSWRTTFLLVKFSRLEHGSPSPNSLYFIPGMSPTSWWVCCPLGLWYHLSKSHNCTWDRVSYFVQNFFWHWEIVVVCVVLPPFLSPLQVPIMMP